ncbi:MAG TPA: ATP-binding protein [bacterium]|nr:ATP-binding protein [bacterium]
MEFQRTLKLDELLKKKSFFLFGPRSTGKTFLINKQFSSDTPVISLLDSEYFLRLSQEPQLLEQILLVNGSMPDTVVLDEIQKIPQLLSEVHRLLDKYKQKTHFLLTGSSARKLRKHESDMLAGRAWTANLFPLTTAEIADFQLERYLRYGGLPQVWMSEEPQEELVAYANTYLKEEITAEGLVRKLAPFARFLKTAALCNGQLMNFSQVASDAAVSASTIKDYFTILEDTLLGFMLEPWIFSKKRKAIQTAKFYFFDTGVAHTLADTQHIDRNSNLYGTSFEHFIGLELRAYLSYSRTHLPLTFWRTTHDHEVDFLVGEQMAVEVKATTRVSSHHLKGLMALKEEGVFKSHYIVSQDTVLQNIDGIISMHWREFLNRLWRGELITKT